jgi:hypothetical protein
MAFWAFIPLGRIAKSAPMMTTARFSLPTAIRITGPAGR